MRLHAVCVMAIGVLLAAGCTQQFYPGPAQGRAEVAVISPGPDVVFRTVDGNTWTPYGARILLRSPVEVLPGRHTIRVLCIWKIGRQGLFRDIYVRSEPADLVFEAEAGHEYIVMRQAEDRLRPGTIVLLDKTAPRTVTARKCIPDYAVP